MVVLFLLVVGLWWVALLLPLRAAAAAAAAALAATTNSSYSDVLEERRRWALALGLLLVGLPCLLKRNRNMVLGIVVFVGVVAWAAGEGLFGCSDLLWWARRMDETEIYEGW